MIVINSKPVKKPQKPISNKALKKREAIERNAKEYLKAAVLAKKIIQDNKGVHIGHLINSLKSHLISTVSCAKLLGISPAAFFRLRKKYDIRPLYVIKNDQDNKQKFRLNASKFAMKNFYTQEQLDLIPKSDIHTIQIRAARSLNYPNGVGNPWKWSPRGYHSNGKMKPRMDQLIKLGFTVHYNEKQNNYYVRHKIDEILTKPEVDKLNIKYKKLQAFV